MGHLHQSINNMIFKFIYTHTHSMYVQNSDNVNLSNMLKYFMYLVLIHCLQTKAIL